MNIKIKRLLILFMFIIAILVIISPNEVQATNTVTEEMLIDESCSVNTDSVWSSLPQSGTADNGFAFLSGNWWVLCCQHGNAMTSVKLYLDKLADYEYLTPIDAFLMANMEAYNSGAWSDTGQQAWWATGSGGASTFTSVEDLITDVDVENYTGKSVDELTDEEIEAAYYALVSQAASLEGTGELLDLAYRFETYICMILGGISSSELGFASDYYTEYEIEENIVNGYDLSNITFEYVETETEASVSFSQSSDNEGEDANSFFVGPFMLEYYYDEIFSYISESTLKVVKNNEEITLTYGEDYHFEAVSSSGLDGNGYPLAGVEFYVVIEYQTGMTEVSELSFEYTYTNAGGLYAKYDTYQYFCTICRDYSDIYNDINGWVDEDHTHLYCTACGEYDDEHTHSVEVGEDEDGNPIYKEKSYITTVDECDPNYSTQDLAICSYAYMWTETKIAAWEGEPLNWTKIKIIKTTVNEDNEQVVVDDTFYFLVEINRGDGWVFFEAISITTRNGYGVGISSKIYWGNGDSTPQYRVTEVYYDEEQFTPEAISGETGTLSNGKTLVVQYQNVVEPNEGELQIDKIFSCLSPEEILQIDEEFTFIVTVTGNFEYEGTSYTTDSPLTLTVTISEDDDWTKTISGFTWYGDDAPTYEVEEVELEESKYELLSESGSSGTIKSDTVATATFNNTLKPSSYIHIDKELVSGEEPESGEVFYAKVTIEGEFIYNGTYISDSLEIDDIELNENNNWSWNSKEIIWATSTAPTYTVEETNTGNYANSSIEELTGSQSTVEDGEILSSTLEEKINYIIITNEPVDIKTGYIEIYKILETDDDSLNPEFEFTVTLSGSFTYEGIEYSDTDYTFTVTAVANGDPWISSKITWTGDTAPTYKVEETNIPDEYEFVSISDNDSTVTSQTYITDSLIEDGNVIIKVINEESNETTSDFITIKKIISGDTDYFESLSDSEKIFTFTVEITGTFTYGVTGDSDYEEVKSDTKTIDVEISGAGTWESSIITWDNDVTAPTYKVTETNIPDYAEIDSWSNETSTVKTSFIKGTVGGQVSLIATNNIVGPKEAKIELSKKSTTSDLEGEQFNFNVTLSGSFTYEGTEYSDTDYTFTVTAVANGDPWTSSEITWTGDVAPTYTIEEVLTEEQISNGVELVSITDNGSGTLIDETTHNVVAVNTIIETYERGRIQIDKIYTVDGTEMEGVSFDFEITITYASGETYSYETTVTSGTTYRSSYFYWLSTDTAPTYTVEEINIPEGVTSSLTNASGSLEEDEITYVKANNSGGQSGNLSIVKNTTIEDKVADTDASASFTFDVNVTGTFTYGGKSYVDETMTINVSIEVEAGGSNTWTSGEFTWTGEAPYFCIDETSETTGYYLDSSENCYGQLSSGETLVSTFNNILSSIEILNFTMDLGGTVWNDTNSTDGKLADIEVDGIIGEGESGISGVKVTITRVIVDSSRRCKSNIKWNL